ncbi:MAG: prepilin peptidase [Cyanobacteria bacterium J06632_22]
MYELILAIFVFVVGAAVGSFLNVVIYRLPAGLSLLFPPSRCPKCKTPLKPYDNVPVLGWLWLRGRCRYCHTRVAIRYPLVELGTGILFLCVFGRFGLSAEAVGYWLFVSLLLALALIDFDTMTLPNGPMVLGVVSGWIWQGWIGYQTTQTGAGTLIIVMASLAATLLGLWLISLTRILGSMALNADAMGGADSKLAAMLGAWLGWQGLLLSIFLAALLGTILGGLGLLLSRAQRRQPVPFGPFLALGATLTVFYGTGLINQYLQLFFPLN